MTDNSAKLPPELEAELKAHWNQQEDAKEQAAELQAEQMDDPAEAAKLYRAAGDRFLDREDYRNATRCYRLFLARAGDNGLSPEKGDSWLLTSLKNAAYKEKTHAPPIRD